MKVILEQTRWGFCVAVHAGHYSGVKYIMGISLAYQEIVPTCANVLTTDVSRLP